MKVLLVDNDPDFLNTRAELLERRGYGVQRACGLEEARWLLGQGHVHLAILDIRLVDDADDRDVSGLRLAKDPAYCMVPKIILTDFPSYQTVREALGPVLDGLPPAVDFLDKAEGPEALVQAIERVLDRYVRVNRELHVRWGRQDDLQPSRLVSLIAPGLPGEQLSERAGELEDLFRRLFCDDRELILGRLLTWRRGWVLLSAFAYPSQGQERPFLVACGPQETIRREVEHCQAFVPPGHKDRTVELVASAETVHYGAATYRLEGGKIEEIAALGDFYRRQPTAPVLAAVEDLFQITLGPWYEKGREEHPEPAEALRRDWLTSPDGTALTRYQLELRIGGLGQAALAAGIAGLQCRARRIIYRPSGGAEFSYPHPGSFLYGEHITTDPPTLCGVTHGRLGTTSVLVDGTGRTWVVDLASCGTGPLMRDFVSLETSVKFEMLEQADLAERHELERRLSAMSRLGDDCDVEGLGPRAEKAIRAVARIRSLAADTLGPQMEPYLVGLLFYTAQHLAGYQPELRYLAEELTVFAHMLLSLGIICHRLGGEPAPPPAEVPPQALHGLWMDEDGQTWVEGRLVALTPQSLQLLKYLYDRAEQLCRRSDIARDVFNIQDYSELTRAERRDTEKNTINTAIARLRRAIEPAPSHPRYIRTVRGFGYKLILGHAPSGDESS